MTNHQAGISNRETPEEEQREREQLKRPDNVARDQAGHLISETPAEATEAADESSRAQPGERQSRAGGVPPD